MENEKSGGSKLIIWIILIAMAIFFAVKVKFF